MIRKEPHNAHQTIPQHLLNGREERQTNRASLARGGADRITTQNSTGYINTQIEGLIIVIMVETNFSYKTCPGVS